MDTDTVLKIIQSLENRLTHDDLSLEHPGPKAYVHGMRAAFTEVKNYLEMYIELQVNQVENDMNRGE